MDEIWIPVVGYEGFYEVSNAGRVRSIERKGLYRGRWKDTEMLFRAKDMKVSTTKTGYCYLALKLPNEKSIKYLLHRIVMRAFVGASTADRPQVNHIDGDKANNNLSNLEYCSSQENLLHLTRVLKRKIGGSGGYSKLTEDQAKAVISDKRTLKAIGDEYGISLQAVWYIQKGKNWAHLQRSAS